MNNCLVYAPTETPCEIASLSVDTMPEQDWFATAPMIAMRTAPHAPVDEEVYTSFEQAISDRVLAVNLRLSRISGPVTGARVYAKRETRHTEKMVSAGRSGMEGSGLVQRVKAATHWQHNVRMLCLGMSLLLIGFDVMGLLVLMR